LPPLKVALAKLRIGSIRKQLGSIKQPVKGYGIAPEPDRKVESQGSLRKTLQDDSGVNGDLAP
jgi:hypothetical protein